MFFFLKFSLAIIGIVFLFIFISSFTYLLKTLYFSDIQVVAHLFNNYELCEKNYTDSNRELCENIAISYWMIFVSMISLVMSFLTLFPVFIMKKKKANETGKKKS